MCPQRPNALDKLQSMSTPVATSQTQLMPLRTIVAAAMGMLVILGVVITFMGLDWPFSYAVVGGLIVANILAFTAAEVVGYRTPAAPTGDPERARAMGLQQLRSTTITRMALTEAPGLLALLAAFVTESVPVYLIGAGLALLSMAWHAWPSRRVAGKLERSLDREGGRSQLSELFGGTSAPGYQQY